MAQESLSSTTHKKFQTFQVTIQQKLLRLYKCSNLGVYTNCTHIFWTSNEDASGWTPQQGGSPEQEEKEIQIKNEKNINFLLVPCHIFM